LHFYQNASRFISSDIYFHLQEVEEIVKVKVRRLVQALPDEICQLVRVLAWSRYSDGSRPIEVKMTELVRQDLNPIWRQTGLIVDDIVARGVDGPLAYALADHEKVKPLG
jgi:hypothetical protein